MRIALTLSYNGRAFYGSQQQSHTPDTVLGTLTHVLIQLGITDKPIASGRTDRDVHATGQVIHVDLPEYWNDLKKLHTTLNEMLPKTMHVKKINAVTEAFHARYSATSRVYRYIIKQGVSTPFTDDFITFVTHLDTLQLSHNIKLFEGEHDFSYFMKTGSAIQSTIRHIYKTTAYKHKGYIILYFEANGFLRAQIRMMVGALLQLNAQQIQEMLLHKKKYQLKPAPPNGLYLAKVKYPRKLYV